MLLENSNAYSKIKMGHECHLPWSKQPAQAQKSQKLFRSSPESKQDTSIQNKHTIQNDSNIDMYACMNAPIWFTPEYYV